MADPALGDPTPEDPHLDSPVPASPGRVGPESGGVASGPIRCEQVVLGWSHSSLLGSDGFGPVFASSGWVLPAGDRDAGLGNRARFLPQGAASLITDSVPAPTSLSFEQTPDGIMLIRKTYARRSSRPGQYVTHALLDRSGRLRPAQLWECADAGLLVGEQPDGRADRRWPQVEVPAARAVDQPVLTPLEQSVLSVLLARLGARRPTVLQTRDAALGEQVLRRVIGVLPPALSDRLSLSTFVVDPERGGYDVCVVVPPFSRASRVDVDLDGPQPEMLPDTEPLVAVLVSPGSKPGLDDVTTVGHLRSWLHLRSSYLEELGSDDIQVMLEGPLWRTFLDRIDESGSSALLLDCLLDAEVGPVLRRRLADPDPVLVDQLVRALTTSRNLDVRRLGLLQDELVAAYGERGFAETLLPGLLAAVHEGGEPVVVASSALADLLARHAFGPTADGPVSIDAFTWHAETSFWSELSERWLEQWLLDGGPVRHGVLEGCRREPDGWAASLDVLLVQRRVTQSVAVERLATWPEDEVGLLVRTLLRCERVPRLLVLDVIGAFPGDLIRPLLRDLWPRVAEHARLSPELAAALVVVEEPKRSFWNRRG